MMSYHRISWKLVSTVRQLNIRYSLSRGYKKFYLLPMLVPLKCMKTALCQQYSDYAISQNVVQVKVGVINPERTFFDKFLISCAIGLRCVILFCFYVPLILIYPLLKWNSYLRRKWWRIILLLVQNSGPVVVKLGQWASTRRDLFSREFCDLFSQLHTRMKSHAWRYTDCMLNVTFGEDWPSIFDAFDKEPCGSGCVAQVYRASLNCDALKNHSKRYLFFDCDERRKDVAVKVRSLITDLKRTDEVLHPNIEREVEVDLTVLKCLAYCANKISSRAHALDLPSCVLEFEKTLIKQIDLQHEAEALKTFRKHFQSEPNVLFPKPVFQSPCVLVESFEVAEGNHISDYLDSSDAVLKSELALMGANAILKMLFVNNFVHCDLHPGNIIVQQYQEVERVGWIKNLLTSKSDGENFVTRRRLVFLDTGLTVKLSQRDLRNIQSLFRAVITRNGREVASLLLSQAPQQRCENVEQFHVDIENLVDEALDKTVSLAQVDVSGLLANLMDVVSRHHVNLEPNFTCVILALLVSEGLGRTLDPHLDLLECARKFLF